MFAIGGERCPVELYVSKRPKALLDNGRSVFTNSGEWYTSNPVGKNKIASIMKELISGTGIKSSNKLTNHSGKL